MPGLRTTRSVDLATARVGVDQAIGEARAIECRTCIAVVDASGTLVTYDRMDGAPFNSAQHAQDKAFSAAGNGTATMDMWTYVAEDQQLRLGVLKVPGLSVLGGGVPIVVDGEVVGAVGVSGSCGQQEDHAIASGAVRAIVAAIERGA